MKLLSNSPEQTITIGRELGKLLHPGSILCIDGNLGAGKTHFAKGVALGLQVEEHVTSPTFILINEYEGRLPFYHVDAYRLKDDEEAYELGLEEYLYGAGVTLIEWPDRITELLPEDYLKIFIRLTDEDEEARKFEFSPYGQRYEKLIEELKASVCPGY